MSMTIPDPTQSSRKILNAEGDGCLLLIEALAQSDPVPDTSALRVERKELLTLLAEISKGERSEYATQITQVAERRGMPPQEVAARAGFLLACLDVPGGDDYYTILGVSPTATSQEIRDAWIDRVSIYHPDLHSPNVDWFTQQVARLNEAYHTLKDACRRQEYDERRRQSLELHRTDSIALRRPPKAHQTPVFFGGRFRRRLPAIITGCSVTAGGLMAVSLFLTHPSNRPQATLFPTLDAPAPAAETPSSHQPGPLEEHGGQTLRSQPEKPRAKPRSPRERPLQFVASDIQEVPESPRPRTVLAQALPPLIAEPKSLDRQEIDALLDEYVDAYEKGDLDRLMATLSPKVRERGTLDYQAIRSAYAKGFAGREQIIYRIRNVHVELKGENATVTAQYLISARTSNQPQKGLNVSGRIEWKIQREGDRLKIVAINY